MKKRIGGLAAALISGLLFCCVNVEASDVLPKEGFQKWEEEIYCRPTQIMPSYILTEEDADLLLRIGVLEAGEEDVEGIANVMQVVLNRFESKEFPNTIPEVIFAKKQFCTARRLAKANITEYAYDALERVVYGEYKDNEALYFESMEGKVWEMDYQYLFSYGGHDFYK